MSIIKFETIENELIKYKNDWVLLDTDLDIMVSQNVTPSKQQFERIKN